MPPQIEVTLARLMLQLSTIDDSNCPTRSLDSAFFLQFSDDASCVSTLDTQHLRYEILCHAQFVATDTVLYRQKPTGQSRFEIMDGITGDRLQHLSEKAISVARKMVPQSWRALLGFVENPRWQT